MKGSYPVAGEPPEKTAEAIPAGVARSMDLGALAEYGALCQHAAFKRREIDGMIQKPPLQKIKIPKPCNQKHAPFAEPEFLSPANRIDTRRTSGFRESEVSQVFLGCGCRINKALTTALDLRRAFCTLRQRNTGSQDGLQAMMRRCGLNLLQGCLHSSHEDLKAARRRFSHADYIYLDRRVIK